MTYFGKIATLLLVGGLLVHGAAGASIIPAERCAASELTAVGELASGSLACHATTAARETPPDPCLAAATAVFENEHPPDPCTTTVTPTDVETEVRSVVSAAVGEITGTPEDSLLTTPAAQACAARKLAAIGKAAKAQLGCAATGAQHATLFSAACVERAGAALVKAWGKAEGAGGCATQGDNEALNVSGLLGWGVGHLGGPFQPVICGTPLATWGSGGGGDGQFNTPTGVAVDGSGNVFVADQDNNRVQKFDNTGRFLLTFGWGVKDGAAALETCKAGCQAGLAGSGNGQFHGSQGVAVDGSGNVFISDLGNNRIQKFDNSGKFRTAWGSPGSSDGQFNGPSEVAVDGSGNVLVTDFNNHRIQKFDNNGGFRLTFGWGVKDGAAALETCTAGCQAGLAGSGEGQFNHAFGVAVDGSGNIFVTDTKNYSIQKFTSTGTFLTAWGGYGTGVGQFVLPQGVAVDGGGNVFVADYFNGVQVFTGTGSILTRFGTYAATLLAVDGNGNVFVTDDFHNTIQKFGCPVPPPPPPLCGLIAGDPAAGTAVCGGPCPLEFPFCGWVAGRGCTCVDNPCAAGIAGTGCSGTFCSIQSQSCGPECTCQ
jgi:sugar lactone lactonase YvrE